MIGQTFQVLTEFQFNAGQALAASDQVTKAVEGISQAADDALSTLDRLGLGLMSKLGIGGGILASLTKAVQISEEFKESQLQFAGMLTQNLQYLQGNVGTFNERLAVSEQIMGRVAAIAQRMGFHEDSFMSATKENAEKLMPLGQAGKDFSNAIQLTQGAFSVAPVLGITGQDAAKQVGSIMTGDRDGSLFKLLQSSGAMKGITGEGFDAKKSAEKVTLLNKALSELNVSSGGAASILNTIGGQMTRLKSQFFSPVIGMFRRIGDVLHDYVVQALDGLNSYIEGPGRMIFKNLLMVVQQFVGGSLEDMYLKLRQISGLRHDLSKTLEVGTVLTLLFEAIRGFPLLMKYVPITGAVKEALRGVLEYAVVGLRWLAGWIWALISPFVTLANIFKALRIVLVESLHFLAQFAIILALFQGYRKAQASADLDDKKYMAEEGAVKISQLSVRFTTAIKNILHPFNVLVDAFANMFMLFHVHGGKWAFLITVMEKSIRPVELIGKAMVGFMAVFNAVVGSVLEYVFLIKNLGLKSIFNKDVYKAIGQDFTKTLKEYYDRNLAQIAKGGSVINHTTNIDKVEIRNDFKENAQPDRIAFTLKEQLLKASQNPTGAKGRKFQHTGR